MDNRRVLYLLGASFLASASYECVKRALQKADAETNIRFTGDGNISEAEMNRVKKHAKNLASQITRRNKDRIPLTDRDVDMICRDHEAEIDEHVAGHVDHAKERLENAQSGEWAVIIKNDDHNSLTDAANAIYSNVPAEMGVTDAVILALAAHEHGQALVGMAKNIEMAFAMGQLLHDAGLDVMIAGA